MANVSSYKEDFTMSTPVFEKDLTGLLVVDPYNCWTRIKSFTLGAARHSGYFEMGMLDENACII